MFFAAAELSREMEVLFSKAVVLEKEVEAHARKGNKVDRSLRAKLR
jgi:hypothetical protein